MKVPSTFLQKLLCISNVYFPPCFIYEKLLFVHHLASSGLVSLKVPVLNSNAFSPPFLWFNKIHPQGWGLVWSVFCRVTVTLLHEPGWWASQTQALLPGTVRMQPTNSRSPIPAFTAENLQLGGSEHHPLRIKGLHFVLLGFGTIRKWP